MLGTTYDLLQVEIIWGDMANGGSNVLVGYSPGGSSADPGATNLTSIVSPMQTNPGDKRFELVSIGAPVQGASSVPFDLVATNVPANALLHAGIVGLANPSVPLGPLGMPGCTLHASLDVLFGPVSTLGTDVTWSPLTLPALPPSFAGLEFYVQSALFVTPINDAFGVGAVTSNGLHCTVGTF